MVLRKQRRAKLCWAKKKNFNHECHKCCGAKRLYLIPNPSPPFPHTPHNNNKFYFQSHLDDYKWWRNDTRLNTQILSTFGLFRLISRRFASRDAISTSLFSHLQRNNFATVLFFFLNDARGVSTLIYYISAYRLFSATVMRCFRCGRVEKR